MHQASEGLELHDRAELEHPSDKNGRGLLVGGRAVVEAAHRVHRRDVQRVEEIELRLHADVAKLDRLGHVEVELVDAVSELGVRGDEWHGERGHGHSRVDHLANRTRALGHARAAGRVGRRRRDQPYRAGTVWRVQLCG